MPVHLQVGCTHLCPRCAVSDSRARVESGFVKLLVIVRCAVFVKCVGIAKCVVILQPVVSFSPRPIYPTRCIKRPRSFGAGGA
jgi:hypothetical protein